MKERDNLALSISNCLKFYRYLILCITLNYHDHRKEIAVIIWMSGKCIVLCFFTSSMLSIGYNKKPRTDSFQEEEYLGNITEKLNNFTIYELEINRYHLSQCY